MSRFPGYVIRLCDPQNSSGYYDRDRVLEYQARIFSTRVIFELAIDRYCSNAQPGATRRRMMSLQLSAEMVGGIASVASCHDLVGSRLSSGRAARRTLATLVVGTVTAVQFLNSCASSCCRRRRGDVSVPTSSGTR